MKSVCGGCGNSDPSKVCFGCMHDFKKKPGRPKQSETKKAFSLRLSNDVIDIIRSKSNQVAYIEDLVRKDIVTK